MATTFKKQFIANGLVAHVIKRKSGKNTFCYEIRYRSNGFCISAAANDLNQAKTKFFAWLRRSGYTLEYIAERLATTPDDIVLRLRRREKFNERELRILIYLMGAKDAFFVIYFPSFRFRKYVYRCVFGKKMRCRKRRRWKKK